MNLRNDGYNAVGEDTLAEQYFFHNGYMLKNRECYDKLTNEHEEYIIEELMKDAYSFSDKWLHPDTIFPVKRGSTLWYAKQGQYIFSAKVTPKFGYYIHNINGQGDVLSFININYAEKEKETSTNAQEDNWAPYFS